MIRTLVRLFNALNDLDKPSLDSIARRVTVRRRHEGFGSRVARLHRREEF